MKPTKPIRCWLHENGEIWPVPPECTHVGEALPPGGEFPFWTPHDGWNWPEGSGYVRIHVTTEHILLQAGSLAACEHVIRELAWDLGDWKFMADIHCPTAESPGQMQTYERKGKNTWIALPPGNPTLVHPLSSNS